MDTLMGRQVDAAIAALNAALQAANRNYAGQLSPYYSALEGRAAQTARAAAGQAGLTTSGLATAAQADISAQIGADFLRALTEIEERNLQRLMAAQANLAQIFGQQAGMQMELAGQYAQMGPDLSWLPLLVQARPDLFRFNFGSPNPTPTPGAPGDYQITPMV